MQEKQHALVCILLETSSNFILKFVHEHVTAELHLKGLKAREISASHAFLLFKNKKEGYSASLKD